MAELLVLAKWVDYPGRVEALVGALRRRFGQTSVHVRLDQDATPIDLAHVKIILVIMSERWFVVRGGVADGEHLDLQREQDGEGLELDLDESLRQSLADAIAERKRIIPVLLGDLAMPPAEWLPPDMANLVSYQAFNLDMGTLEKRFPLLLAQITPLIESQTGRKRLFLAWFASWIVVGGLLLLGVWLVSVATLVGLLVMALTLFLVPTLFVSMAVYFAQRRRWPLAVAFIVSLVLNTAALASLVVGLFAGVAYIWIAVVMIAVGFGFLPNGALLVHLLETSISVNVPVSRTTRPHKSLLDGYFLSYRRADTIEVMALVHNWLVRQGMTVFFDLVSISQGADFAEALDEALNACAVVLVLIGHQWLSIINDNGVRRLDDPDDFVRREVAAALSRGAVVVPLLVNGAMLPRATDLPPDLAPLASTRPFPLRTTGRLYRRDLRAVIRYAEPQVGIIRHPRLGMLDDISSGIFFVGILTIVVRFNLLFSALVHFAPWMCNTGTAEFCRQWNNLDGLGLTASLTAIGTVGIVVTGAAGAIVMWREHRWRLLIYQLALILATGLGLGLMSLIKPAPHFPDVSALLLALLATIIVMLGLLGVSSGTTHLSGPGFRIRILHKTQVFKPTRATR